MKKWIISSVILVIILFANKANGQTYTQTFIDKCTGETKVATTTYINGNAVVSFYNQIKTFTPLEVQTGQLQVWLQTTYAAYNTLACPVSTVVQQTITNAVAQAAAQAAASAAHIPARAAHRRRDGGMPALVAEPGHNQGGHQKGAAVAKAELRAGLEAWGSGRGRFRRSRGKWTGRLDVTVL